MFTILIVDDESIELRYLSGIFARHPEMCRVVAWAENGEQAISMAALHRPDVIIMDISMPLLNGLEAARRIRRQIPGQIIILNSAYAEFEMAHQAVTDQLDAYLLKPTPEDTIFATIYTCLERKRRETFHGKDVLSHTKVQFPYDTVDRILQALSRGEQKLLQSNAQDFSAFLRKQNAPDRYRLYVINTLFSIEQALHRSDVPENLTDLLDCGRYIGQISRLEFWSDVCACCDEFFSRLFLVCQERSPAPKSATKIVAQYIDEHYMEDLKLEDLAALVHFRPTYLSRVFRADTGTTIRACISRRRIRQATYLLCHSDRLLRDIAGDCGFKNLSHFHRVYKECTGMTPSEVRTKGDAHDHRDS